MKLLTLMGLSLCLTGLLSPDARAAGQAKANAAPPTEIYFRIDPSRAQLRCEERRLLLAFEELEEISEGHLSAVKHDFYSESECGVALKQLKDVFAGLAQGGSSGLEASYEAGHRFDTVWSQASADCDGSICHKDVEDRVGFEVSLSLLGWKFEGYELLHSTIRTETWPAGICPPYAPDCDL